MTVPTPTADRIGRGLLWLCSVATLGAFANGIKIMTEVSDERVITEAWRTFAYLVFAGLWAMLAMAPRAQRGVWELVLLQKIAITVFALVAMDLSDGRTSGRSEPPVRGCAASRRTGMCVCSGT